MKLEQLFCFHKFGVIQRYSKLRKINGKTVYDVYEVDRCWRCGKAKCQGLGRRRRKRYEKCIGSGLSQAKAQSLMWD